MEIELRATAHPSYMCLVLEKLPWEFYHAPESVCLCHRTPSSFPGHPPGERGTGTRTVRYKREVESAVEGPTQGSLFIGEADSRAQAGMQGQKTQGNQGTMSG